MVTVAWQSPAMQTTIASISSSQGHWGVINAGANHQQGPPQGPFSPVASEQNANDSKADASNSAARPITVPTTTPGGHYVVSSQSQPSYCMSSNTHLGTIWPFQQSVLNSGPTAVGMPSTDEGLRPGMAPLTSISAGLCQGVPSNVLPSQVPSHQPFYQRYPPNNGPRSVQQIGTPWIQPSQQFQHPTYKHPLGNYPGAFQGQRQPLGPTSNGMLAGDALGVISGFVMPSQGARCPVIWAQGPSGPSSSIPAVSISADAGIRATIYTSAGSGTPREMKLKFSGCKAGNGSSQAAVDPSDMWTAHKTDKGIVYYFNSVTGESTYKRPEGFKGESAKVTIQPTPVSWERLSSTHWSLVTTDDGKKYYYNTESQASCWEVPPEVAVLRKKQEAAPEPTIEIVATGTSAVDKSLVSFTRNVPAAIVGGREAIGHKIVTNSALDLIKKKLQDSGAPVTVSATSGTSPGVAITVKCAASLDAGNGKGLGVEGTKVKLHRGDHASSDESSDSEDEDLELRKERKVNEFKEMLKEKGVAPFSKWEKELPKIIFDPRFKAIPSHTERRFIFEHYVRTRADVERREKRAAQKAAIEGFKQLLEEASKDISHTTTYDSFATLWGQDARFGTLERKDREFLLNDRVGPLRKTAEENVRADRAAAVAGFRSLLSEKGEISSASRWSKVKENLRSDHRYNLVQREEREELFNAIIVELRAVEMEVERAATAKKEEEDKLREKEREARKRKEREDRELQRVRTKVRRKVASSAYQALLNEKIKDPETSWIKARPKLEKDSLSRASNPDVDIIEREQMFRVHVDGLYNRCVRDFRSLLSDLITPEVAAKQSEQSRVLLRSWHDAKKVLKSDPRYSKMPRRERESLWRKHVEESQRRTKETNSTSRDNHHLSANGKALTPARVLSSHRIRTRSPARRIRR